MRNANLMKRGLMSLVFLFGMIFALAQMTVTGSVQDAGGNPVAGATVKVVGNDAISATSDIEGNYALQVPATAVVNGQVSISVINNGETEMKTFAYTEGGSTDQVFTFNTGSKTKLADVVVVGYGTTRKKDATGAVDVLNSEEFNKGLNQSTSDLLNGRVAGVNVTSGGDPGGGAVIRIRGGSSLSAVNDPLVVIDGLPIDNNSIGGSRGILAALNPNDVESVSVLKDAASTAIYGSRASNGVIIITTKKGGKGNLSITYNALGTLNTLAKKVDNLSADQFRDLINANGNAAQRALLGSASTDWQDEIFENTFSFDNNISLRGKLFNAIPSRLSLGYTTVPGILKTEQFQRTTTSLALNPTFFDNHLKFDFNANVSWEKNRFADRGAIGSAIVFDPTQSVYDVTSPFGGFFEWMDSAGNEVTLAGKNPLAMLVQRRNIADTRRVWGNFQTEYKLHFFPALKAVVNLGFDESKGEGRNILDGNSVNGVNPSAGLGEKSIYNQLRTNKLLDAYLNFNKLFGNLKTDLTAGYSYQKFENHGYNSGNLYAAVSTADPYIDTPVVLVSFFGRANFEFLEKYLLTLNYRRDGSSRFIGDYRWGNFPGIAFAWKLKEESFLKDSSIFDDLKLRLSWGIVGQQDIPTKDEYIRKVSLSNSTAQYPFASTYYTTARPQGYNESLKWEETSSYNLGFDFAVLKSRLKGNLDFFYKESNDLLAFVAWPDGANLWNAGFANIGDLTSKGVELGLDYKIIKSDDMQWSVYYNATYNNVEVTNLNGNTYDVGGIAGGVGNNIQRHEEGFTPFSFYVYEQVYDGNGRPIPGAYVDQNGDGVINSSDRRHYKKPNADITMGLMSNFSYKNFDASVAFRASIGNYVFDNVNSDKGYLQGALRRDTDLANITTDYYNTGFFYEDNGTSRYLSDYFIKNGSFLKWDNITFGYTFNKAFDESSSLRLFTGVQNVLIISGYEGMDPEIFGGIDNNIYPRARMFLLGLNFNF